MFFTKLLPALSIRGLRNKKKDNEGQKGKKVLLKM